MIMDTTPMECKIPEGSVIFSQEFNSAPLNFLYSDSKEDDGHQPVDSADPAKSESVAFTHDGSKEDGCFNLSELTESNDNFLGQNSVNHVPLVSNPEKDRDSNTGSAAGESLCPNPPLEAELVISIVDIMSKKEYTDIKPQSGKNGNSFLVSKDKAVLESSDNEKGSDSVTNVFSVLQENMDGSSKSAENQSMMELNSSSSSFSNIKEENSVAMNLKIGTKNSDSNKNTAKSDFKESGEEVSKASGPSDLDLSVVKNNNTELSITKGLRSEPDAANNEGIKEKNLTSQKSSQQKQDDIQLAPGVTGSLRTRSNRSTLLPRACKNQSRPASRARSKRNSFGIKAFNCGVCKESFASKELLKKHVAEVHEGKANAKERKDKHSDASMISCPLCKATFTRKHGLKRHFTNKHSSVKIIPCQDCPHTAKNLQEYLNHTEVHKALNTFSPHFMVQRNGSSQLKCRECHQYFQNNDALKLHVLNHNVVTSLSSAEASLPASQNSASNLISVFNQIKASKAESNKSDVGQTLLSHLPEELMSTIEQSLDTVSNVTTTLGSLTHSISTEFSSLSAAGFSSLALIEKLFQALNFISSLSTGLSSLSSTVGQILLTDSIVPLKINGSEEKSECGDIEEPDSHHEGETCKMELSQEAHDDSKAGPFVAEAPSMDQEKEDTTKHNVQKDRMVVSFPQVKNKKRAKRGHRKLIISRPTRKACKSREPHDHVCSHCGKEFKDCGRLRRHAVAHEDQRPYKCKMCKVDFHRKHHLKRHMLTHTEGRPFKCDSDSCSYSAKTAKTLHTHSLLHGQDRSFPCDKCTYVGRTLYELSRHEKKHNPCRLCSYVPLDSADYTMHKRSHLNYSCTECDYSCYSSWQLRRHSKKHNPPSKDQQKFCCELCGYSCFEKRHFDYHMARHENKTPYSCPNCDYKCSSRTSFDAHKLMHAGLKPFLCSICGASFRRTSYLNNHMLIHKDEKKHVCRMCGHPFRSRYNLKVHEMTHTGEKQFKCHLCNFACRRNKELRLHLEKHKFLEGVNDRVNDEVKLPLLQDVKEEC